MSKFILIFLLFIKSLDLDIFSKRENININFNLNNNSLLNSLEGETKKYMKTLKYSSLNKSSKNKNISPKQNKSQRNINKQKETKKEIIDIIPKKHNNINIRHTNYINKFKDKKFDYMYRRKKENMNNTINSKKNIILNSILSKNKKNQKNKKVKIVGISYHNNNKNKTNNINSNKNSSIPSPSRLNSKKKPNFKITHNYSNLNGYSISNYNQNIVHRYTKSSYNQETHLFTNFIKDLNKSDIKNSKNNQKENKYNKRNIINSYLNYNTKQNANKDAKIKKITKIPKNVNNNLTKHKRDNSDKGGLNKIIEELKIKNKNNNGLTKKFINAQNNWRKNYFATVIQKIYRGYFLRKSNYREKYSNKNMRAVYIKKKAKDNNIFGNNLHHRKCPTEENLNFICQDINKKYNDKINQSPPKIKEIVIVRNIKKDINPQFQFSNLYLNNYIYNYNDTFNQANYNIFLYKCKYIFEKWKEYCDKKKILYSLKTMKKYNKQKNRFYNDEKKNENIENNYNKNFIKQIFI